MAMKGGRPRSQFYVVAGRIASRFAPRVARAFEGAIAKYVGNIDPASLTDAVVSGNPDLIHAALGTGGNLGTLLTDSGMEAGLLATARGVGGAAMDIVVEASGVRGTFNVLHPNVVLYARQQTAQLVVDITDDLMEAIRVVLGVAQAEGLTIVQQARAIREIVGLPPNWAAAPLNLRRELEAGRFTSTRRLSAADKAAIRKRIKDGTMDEAFIARMEQRYRNSLIHRRALNIARTETHRAAMHGQRESWRQAVRQGVLPATARRVWIVTPDERLREEHAAIPAMNEGGVAMDQPFQTPDGPTMGPPWGVNCRCAEGLIFPGLRGVL